MEKRISLPESLVARVELELYSDLEGKVPFGAWQALITRLLQDHLEDLEYARTVAKQMQEADK